MSRLNLLLLALLFASSLVLVKAAYDTRRLRAEIYRASVESERLEGERKAFEAERRLQATTRRIDSTARDKLGMRGITPGMTMYEQGSAGATPAAAATKGSPP